MESYCYLSKKFVTSDELRSCYELAHQSATKKNLPLTICVNNIKTDQAIEKIFIDQVQKNKLQRYQTIEDRSITVQLKSPRGIDTYQEYGIILAIHSGPEALKKLEEIKKFQIFFLIAEIHNDGSCAHLEEWAVEHKVKKLKKTETE